MKLIITEEQNEKLTRRVKTIVDKLGVRDAIKMLGGNTNLIKRVYENNPLEFMDKFKDMESVLNPNLPTRFLYEKNGKIIMEQDILYKEVWVNYDEIWYFFENIFDMGYMEIQDILSQWLEENLNLKGYTPETDFNND
jgi:hypothetical protein